MRLIRSYGDNNVVKQNAKTTIRGKVVLLVLPNLVNGVVFSSYYGGRICILLIMDFVGELLVMRSRIKIVEVGNAVYLGGVYFFMPHEKIHEIAEEVRQNLVHLISKEGNVIVGGKR